MQEVIQEWWTHSVRNAIHNLRVGVTGQVQGHKSHFSIVVRICFTLQVSPRCVCCQRSRQTTVHLAITNNGRERHQAPPPFSSINDQRETSSLFALSSRNPLHWRTLWCLLFLVFFERFQSGRCKFLEECQELSLIHGLDGTCEQCRTHRWFIC